MAQQRVGVEPGNSIIGNRTLLTGGNQSLTQNIHPCYSVVVQADSTNSDPVYLITTAGGTRCFEVAVGASIAVDVASPHLVYVQGTADEYVYWFAIQR